jgi:hypothetical protein
MGTASISSAGTEASQNTHVKYNPNGFTKLGKMTPHIVLSTPSLFNIRKSGRTRAVDGTVTVGELGSF